MIHPPTVLVAESDPALVRLFERALRLKGYHVLTAADGEAAIATAQQVRPDVVLIQLRLPRMDGWAVIAALQEEPWLRDMPVVVLTYGPAPLDDERPRTAPIAGYVEWPTSVDHLLEVVEHALKTARPAPD